MEIWSHDDVHLISLIGRLSAGDALVPSGKPSMFNKGFNVQQGIPIRLCSPKVVCKSNTLNLGLHILRRGHPELGGVLSLNFGDLTVRCL